MRMLISIRDSKGELKLCWFGNPSISDDIEKDLDNKCLNQQLSIFTIFIKDKELMQKLESNIKHLSFYTEKDYAEMNANYKSSRKSLLNKYQLFEDSSIGVNILNNIANNDAKNIKTFSYIKYFNDSMFVFATFEIDFLLGAANVRVKNTLIKNFKFRDSVKIESAKINKKVTRTPKKESSTKPNKKKRSRPKKVNLW